MVQRHRRSSAKKVGYLRSFLRFFRDREASLLGKGFVLVTIAYVLWPIDLIPDVAPVVGWLDDLGLATVAMLYLTRVAAKYRETPALVPATAPEASLEWPTQDAYAPAYVRR